MVGVLGGSSLASKDSKDSTDSTDSGGIQMVPSAGMGEMSVRRSGTSGIGASPGGAPADQPLVCGGVVPEGVRPRGGMSADDGGPGGSNAGGTGGIGIC